MERKGKRGPQGYGRDRKEAIIQAAEELFAQKGYDGTSIREIAGRARTNTALLYYYFEGKEGLYRSILERAVMEVPQVLEGWVSSPAGVEEKLLGILQMMGSLGSERALFFQMMHRELATDSPRLGFLAEKYFARNYELGRVLVKEAIGAGLFRELDLELTPISLVAMVFFFFYNRFVVERILGLDPLNQAFVQRLVAHTLDLFLHGALAGAVPLEVRTTRSSGKRKPGRRASPPKKSGSAVPSPVSSRAVGR